MMMKNWIPMIILIVVCIFGFIKVFLSKRESENEKNFAISYLNKYREFSNDLIKDNYNSDTYEWLKLNSAKMQTQMGEYGIAQAYKPAFSDLIYHNYQVIVNGISRIRDLHRQVGTIGVRSGLGANVLYDEISGIDDMLLTYIGAKDNHVSNKVKEMKNPIVWLREGVRTVVTLPISIMFWSGIIHYGTYNTLVNNFFVNLISFLVASIGLVSSIVTIVTGYEPFMQIIDKIK